VSQRVNGILVNGSLVVSALLAISVHSALLFGWEWDTAPYADIPAAREQGISIDLTQAPKLKVDKTPDLPAGTVNQPVRKQPDIPEPAPEPAPVPKPEKIPRPKAQPQLPQSTPPSQTRQTAETPNY
jgi:outer membrane biosynthesis protein TonB